MVNLVLSPDLMILHGWTANFVQVSLKIKSCSQMLNELDFRNKFYNQICKLETNQHWVPRLPGMDHPLRWVPKPGSSSAWVSRQGRRRCSTPWRRCSRTVARWTDRRTPWWFCSTTRRPSPSYCWCQNDDEPNKKFFYDFIKMKCIESISRLWNKKNWRNTILWPFSFINLQT